MGRIRWLVVVIALATVMGVLSSATFKARLGAAKTQEKWDKRGF
jgi:hypothetical protein